jgi:LysM repeat protein
MKEEGMRERLFIRVILFLMLFSSVPARCETIDVHIKGIDDGVESTRQKDYKEAVLFAKREAIERAGVKVKAMTTVQDLVVNSDYIESQAEGILLPGYDIVDVGYTEDGTYQVVLVGKVAVAETRVEEPAPPEGYVYHTVVAGETLASLSAQYRVPIKQLYDINNLTNAKLKTGQKILVPAGSGGTTQGRGGSDASKDFFEQFFGKDPR